MAPLESLQSELQDVNRKIAQVRGRNMALPKLYKRIKEHLSSQAKTKAAFARDIGVAPSTFGRFMSGTPVRGGTPYAKGGAGAKNNSSFGCAIYYLARFELQQRQAALKVQINAITASTTSDAMQK